ncbi:MAG: RNA polymerase sigma factor [Novosphingobium sp.]|nr:RNA polymerase sigma factor [Novosphingobium sp.]
MGEKGGLASVEPLGGVSLHAAFVDHRGEIVAQLRRRTGSQEAAEDLAQETWLRALQAVEGGTAIDNPVHFLRRVASNLAIDWLRRNRFRAEWIDANTDHTLVADCVPDLDAERALQARQAFAHLLVIVDELPQAQREAFLLFQGEGYSTREVARKLGVSPKSIESRIGRAVAHIRQRLVKLDLWP